MSPRKRGLGMGLASLLGDAQEANDPVPAGRLRLVPIEKLHPSPFQPRRHFAEDELQSLAQSLQDRGVLQPLLVRPSPDSDGYEIIAGERRWRAAQRAGLHELPVVLRELGDSEMLELALIENVQRQDLNPLEEAQAYRRLMNEFGYTQEKLSGLIGKSRPHVANTLRLLNLPDDVQAFVLDGKISAGHARALLSAEHAGRIAREVIRRGLSVRETENLVHAARRAEATPRARPLPDADLAAIQSQLAERLGLQVTIRPSKTGGTVTLRYSEGAQLEGLIERLISGG